MSRSGYYKSLAVAQKQSIQSDQVVRLVQQVRYYQPRIGGKKLYRLLKPDLDQQQVSLGRDKFFELLRSKQLLVKRRRKYTRTTHSWHRFHTYRNQLQGTRLTGPCQAYASDITYLRTAKGFVYLFLQTDVFSRKITGWDLSDSLSISGALRAMKMTLKQQGPSTGKVIHHSDRGIQYCCKAYVNLLTKHGIQISMTEKNHCYENALAERVNGILKEEFLLDETFTDQAAALKAVREAIHSYNHRRPHWSLNLLTPQQVHEAA